MTSPIAPTHAGVIAYRRCSRQLELVLITALRGGRWIIPKGRIEPDLTPLESARQEAYEEAGLRGRIEPQPLGYYHHYKRESKPLVEVYRMEVTEVLEEWPEAAVRTRAWVPLERARVLVYESDLRALLKKALGTV